MRVTIRHVDDLLLYPEYMEKKKQLILDSHITVGECWNWTKCTNNKGRAHLKIGGSMQYAARVSYVLFNKEKVGSLYVLHTCDNIICINPEHLWLGTQFDNMQDMVKKGRGSNNSGESNPFSKLTKEDVAGIKSMVLSGHTLASTALKYGISYQHVSRIVKQEAWT